MEGTSESAYTQNASVVGRSAARWKKRRRNSESAHEVSRPSRRFLIVSAFCCAVRVRGVVSRTKNGLGRKRGRASAFGGGVRHGGRDGGGGQHYSGNLAEVMDARRLSACTRASWCRTSERLHMPGLSPVALFASVSPGRGH